VQALKDHDPTLVFEIQQGRGIFSFLMFFSDEDIESRDILYLYLGNTRVFLTIKLYGSHVNGDFKAYINDEIKKKIIAELQLGNGNDNFDFQDFLDRLNALIPQTLSIEKKVEKTREIWPAVGDNLRHVVDEADKTELMGVLHLPSNKRPRDKTLRKLYMFIGGDSTDIRRLITDLKKSNVTLLWTNDAKGRKLGLKEIFQQI
jgi:hypothetical protein